MNRKKIILFIGALGILFFVILWFLKASSEQEKIKRALKKGEKAFVRKDLRTCLEFISENYSDNNGFTKQDIEKTLNEILPQLEEIKVKSKDLKVDVEKNKAAVSLALQVFAKFNGVPTMLVGTPTEAKEIILFMKKENYWKIERIEGVGN